MAQSRPWVALLLAALCLVLGDAKRAKPKAAAPQARTQGGSAVRGQASFKGGSKGGFTLRSELWSTDSRKEPLGQLLGIDKALVSDFLKRLGNGIVVGWPLDASIKGWSRCGRDVAQQASQGGVRPIPLYMVKDQSLTQAEIQQLEEAHLLLMAWLVLDIETGLAHAQVSPGDQQVLLKVPFAFLKGLGYGNLVFYVVAKGQQVKIIATIESDSTEVTVMMVDEVPSIDAQVRSKMLKWDPIWTSTQDWKPENIQMCYAWKKGPCRCKKGPSFNNGRQFDAVDA